MDRLRRTGMSIAEMRQYTTLVKQGKGTLRQRQTLLTSHRVRVEETIAEWTHALELIDGKIDFYGEWLTTGQRPALPSTLRVQATREQPNGKTASPKEASPTRCRTPRP